MCVPALPPTFVGYLKMMMLSPLEVNKPHRLLMAGIKASKSTTDKWL